MRRTAFAILALLSLVAAGILLWQYGVAESRESVLASVCLRAGLVMGAIWLAYPQLKLLLKKISPVTVAIFAVGIVIVVIRARLILIVGPVLLALIFLNFTGRFLRQPPPRRRRRSAGVGATGSERK